MPEYFLGGSLLYDITRQVAKGTVGDTWRATATFVGVQEQQVLKLRVNIQASLGP